MRPNSDQDLSRILAALRDIEAPRGMEQRVMAAIEQREASVPARNYAWGFAALAAAALVTAMVAFWLMPRLPNSHPTAVTNAPTLAAPVQAWTLARAHSEPVTPIAVPHRNHPVPVSRRSNQLLCDCDPTAVAEANAPSLPAPELPLTEQERLLRRIAQHPDQVQVAELTSAGREASSAADKDDFKTFFTPPQTASAPE